MDASESKLRILGISEVYLVVILVLLFEDDFFFSCPSIIIFRSSFFTANLFARSFWALVLTCSRFFLLKNLDLGCGLLDS